jgi:protein arginine kinase activator
MPVKCQRCEKPATFHITELTDDKPRELHFCEDCAKSYLEKEHEEAKAATPTLAGVLAQQLKLGQTANELARLDQKACPVCGITFFEFRKQGRLGCPHDYVCFERELDPLIMNIHGESTHTGKRPKRFVRNTDKQTEIIRLRRDMQAAVEKEDYERASQIRDELLKLEGEQPEG